MRIQSFRIKNFKSWSDSGTMEFDQGINIIVGKNNSGKTALLDALSLTRTQSPHISEATKPTVESQNQNPSEHYVTFTLDKDEMTYLLLNPIFHGIIYIPIPKDGVTPNDGVKLANEKIKLAQTLTVTFHNHTVVTARFDTSWYGESIHYIFCRFNKDTKTLELEREGLVPLKDTAQRSLEFLLASHLKTKICYIRAERFNLHRNQPSGTHTILKSNSENLPDVLNYLQTKRPPKYSNFINLVKRVLPGIQLITAPPADETHYPQIFVWSDKINPNRDDLARPLEDSGTGVGQVLAMLFVIVSSDYPQVIIIDEPQSFLHPGAFRALMEVFNFNKSHQYIFSTHSPSALSMVNTPILQIVHDGIESKLNVISTRENLEMRMLLEDLGSKLSDFFGSDSILWVEGPTEERCFTIIMNHLHDEPMWGIQIIGVRSTGDLHGKYAELSYDVYAALSRGTALIPSAVGFIFDAEKKSDEAQKELVSKSKNLVHFLKRRMFENYLLYPEAIIQVINNLPDFHPKKIEVRDIVSWIEKNYSLQHKVFSDQWYESVDGAALLNKLFNHFSETRYSYHKIEHGAYLVEELLKSKPEVFREIYLLLKKIIESNTAK